jgi:hypothetical protein
MSTKLAISGIQIPPYSARGLSQTLVPIEASASMRRTINGALVDISASQFRKYASTISCTDQQHPALNGVWPGQQVTVNCVCELSYLTSGGSADRTPVSGSSRVEGDFTFYRPQLVMRVVSYEVQTDEYGAAVAWSLQLEEV